MIIDIFIYHLNGQLYEKFLFTYCIYIWTTMKGSAMVYGHQTWEILAQMKEEKKPLLY